VQSCAVVQYGCIEVLIKDNKKAITKSGGEILQPCLYSLLT